MKRHAAPIVAAILLLLPVLGKYRIAEEPHGNYFRGYRNGGNWAWRVFWSLEQIDRKVRPGAWDAGNVDIPFTPERKVGPETLPDN